jgi:hypothetical protein
VEELVASTYWDEKFREMIAKLGGVVEAKGNAPLKVENMVQKTDLPFTLYMPIFCQTWPKTKVPNLCSKCPK